MPAYVVKNFVNGGGGGLLITYLPIIKIPDKSNQWYHVVIFEKQIPTSKANFISMQTTTTF